MKKSALVLSGGGALGVAHVGALEVLEQKYQFDWYAGVSAGAIICSLLAIGKTPKEIGKLIEETSMFDIMFDFRPTQFGFMSGTKIEDTLYDIFEDTCIEDLDVPLAIGATDFSTGERITIRSGSITEAIRASVSVPVIFEPYWHAESERWLVDGGLSQNFPLDLAVEEYKGKHIVGINVGSVIDAKINFERRSLLKRGKDLSHSFARAIQIMFKNQVQPPADNRVKLLEPNVGKYLATDIRKYKELKAAGRKEAKNID